MVRTLSALTALGGLLLLAPLVPVLHSRLGPFEAPIGPLWFQVAGHLVALVTGLGLVTLAGQLARRKRTAWTLATGLFAVGTLANVLKGPHVVSAVYCAALFGGLLAARRHFRALADPPSLLRLLRAGPLWLLAVVVFGSSSLLVEHDRVSPAPTAFGWARTVLAGLVGLDGPYDYQRPFFASFFPKALLTFGILGLVGLAVLLFRPVQARRPHTEQDWSHAERLVHQYGWDTLAYFALRDDKSFFYASDGEAMIAYTYLGGFALASGDPIGAPASVPLVLDEFLAFCEQRAWRPAFLAVREADVPLYASRGFGSTYLGDEALIRCESFSLDGPAMKGVRAANRRVAKRYRFELVRESDAPTTLVDQLNAISEKWRGKAPERGFTMALSQDVTGAGSNPEFLLCVALDEHGVPGGFLRIVPAYGRSFGYTLDLMRHDPQAPNGMTEFLIAQTALALGKRQVSRLSMNFALWGRLFQQDVDLGFGQRMGRRAVRVLNPFFQIESLQEFNAKFSPEWLPRVLVYQEATDLPKVGLLYAAAEGFLAVPGLGPLFVPTQVGGVPSPSTAVRRAA